VRIFTNKSLLTYYKTRTCIIKTSKNLWHRITSDNLPASVDRKAAAIEILMYRKFVPECLYQPSFPFERHENVVESKYVLLTKILLTLFRPIEEHKINLYRFHQFIIKYILFIISWYKLMSRAIIQIFKEVISHAHASIIPYSVLKFLFSNLLSKISTFPPCPISNNYTTCWYSRVVCKHLRRLVAVDMAVLNQFISWK